MVDRIVIIFFFFDQTGIVAAVSAKASSLKRNIIDIAQKALEDNIFAMKKKKKNIGEKDIKSLQDEFQALEDEIGVRIFLQHEEIFRTMHRI